MKVLFVFGTRPEAIKMAPLIIRFKKSSTFETRVCVTGQHREMLKDCLDVFGIVPDYDLDIMTPGQSLTDITTKVLEGIGAILDDWRPEIVLVHGDTTTSYASALAAFYRGIKIGHVEAGLRTYDVHAPFPEEFNRQSISIISDYDFCPTETAKHNLLTMGKDEKSIVVTGNTAIDALQMTLELETDSSALRWANGRKLIFMTCHRRENLGDPMKNIFAAVNDFALANPSICVVYPVHPNPRVRDAAQTILTAKNILLTDPVNVVECHHLIAHSYFVLTDSGGLQEEAPALHKPVLVLREKTERPEGVEAGTLLMAGTHYESVYQSLQRLLNDSVLYNAMASSKNPYGDGKASERIYAFLETKFLKEAGL